MSRRAFQILVLAVGFGGTAVLLALILLRTDGMLIYTLDDPYIHLAVAQEIQRGGYGINPGQTASPSSSMIYALLLVPLLALGLADWAPLVFSFMGQAVALWLLAGLAAPLVAGVWWRAGLAAVLLPLSINGLALPLTGMEHPIHAATVVAVIIGLWKAAQGRAPDWLVPAILLGAAIRFEGYALALVAILLLAVLRQTRAALGAGIGLATLTLGYALVMHWLDLPLLPSSVMVKSPVSAAAADADFWDAFVGVIANAITAVSNRWGVIFGMGALVFAVVAARRKQPIEGRTVAFAGLCLLGAHLLVGRYGWFGRYEVYAVAGLLAASLLLLPRMQRGASAVALVLMAVLASGYGAVTWQTPAAAQATYQQQYQMHRFATDYFPRPVAVNDLGWVAYDNDTFVLDLWGLGSETARRVTQSGGRTAQTMDILTAGWIDYAMIYDIAFDGAIPAQWCRIGQLTTSRVIAASDQVAFYLIDRSQEDAMRSALQAFAPTLPDGAVLSMAPCEG